MLEEGEIDEENCEVAAAMRKKRTAQWAVATATALMCRSDCMAVVATAMAIMLKCRSDGMAVVATATASVPMCRSNWMTMMVS